ncbi:MAG: ureidoglycolate lyase [Alphaproteobacteria bacterium]|jgi:ureidoglycolate lyase
MKIIAKPFDAVAFEPFGECFALRDENGERHDFAAHMANGRSHATLNVSIGRAKPVTGPIKVAALERHDQSAQTFAPIVVGRWLAAVAPTLPNGQPDFEKLQAFVMDETVGICYRPNVWHHPFACFDQAAEMLMLRWDDRTEADTSWAKTPEGVNVEIVLP